MADPETNFFQAGGTLSIGAPSYIKRPADDELLRRIKNHDVCLILAPRQMGKSSLMVHAYAELRRTGVAAAIIDLQPLGAKREGQAAMEWMDAWFRDVVDQIDRQLAISAKTSSWWIENRHLGPTQRFRNYLEEMVLINNKGDVVLFMDEIDSVLGLPFSDEFFTTLRSLKNAAAHNETFQRLTFVLLGVATPSSFIKDKRRTPFNVSDVIPLRDFSFADILPFAEVLGPNGQAIIERIYYWTHGQPYLVQSLAEAACELPEMTQTPERLDEQVEASFLLKQIELDTHLKFIQDYLLDETGDTGAVLRLYKDVLEGRRVAEDEHSHLQDRLKLAGVVSGHDGQLVVRNPIYRQVFSRNWIRRHMPRNTKRDKARRWVAAISVGSVLMGLVYGVVAFGVRSGSGSPFLNTWWLLIGGYGLCYVFAWVASRLYRAGRTIPFRVRWSWTWAFGLHLAATLVSTFFWVQRFGHIDGIWRYLPPYILLVAVDIALITKLVTRLDESLIYGATQPVERIR